MKTPEEVKQIFLEEAKKTIENNYLEFNDLTNSFLNKSPDSEAKYQVLLQKFKDCLPNRGVTEEEFKAFLPHLNDCMVDLTPYIINAMLKGKKK